MTRLNAAVAAQQAPTTPKIPSQQRRAAYKALIDYITRVRGNAVVLTSTHAAGEVKQQNNNNNNNIVLIFENSCVT